MGVAIRKLAAIKAALRVLYLANFIVVRWSVVERVPHLVMGSFNKSNAYAKAL